MAKGTRVTKQERDAIIAALGTGKSCNQIAKDFNRANRTISLIARDVGHKFSQVNAARAREIKAVYDDERRAALKLKNVEAVERLFGQLFAPAKLVKIGGKDNVFTEADLNEPTFQDKRDITTAIGNLMRVVNQMERNEHGDLEHGLFDVIFQQIRDEADEYSGPASGNPDDDAVAPEGEAGLEHPAS